MSEATGVRTSVRPTAFGAGLLAAVASAALFRPGVADPFLGATVWVAAAVVTVVGSVWPFVAVARIELAVVGRLADVDVGATAAVPLEVTHRWPGVEIAWADRGSGWYRLPTSGPVVAPFVATRRGVFDELVLHVRTGGPLGLLVVTRQRRLPLVVPVHVGPVPLDVPVWLPPAGGAGGAEPAGAASVHGELVRTVRPYVAGDPSHLVHWPTSARAGRPMVRELEQPARRGVVVVVDLDPSTSDEAREVAASHAAGIVRSALAVGAGVHLCTVEAGGPRSAPVVDRAELRRRLARAVSGAVSADGPSGWPVEVVSSRDGVRR